jgi:hypothetical protein
MQHVYDRWRQYLKEEREKQERIIDMYEVEMICTINKNKGGTTAETMALFRALSNVTTIVKNEITDDENIHKFSALLKIVVRKDAHINIKDFMQTVIIPNIRKIDNITIDKIGNIKRVDPGNESFK